MSEFLTTQEAAELIGVTRYQVSLLMRRGKLEGQRFGRDWQVSRASAEAYRDRPQGGPGRPRVKPKKKPTRRKGKPT